jgi:hypothetical protein
MFHGATGFKIENSWFANVGRDLVNLTQVVNPQNAQAEGSATITPCKRPD